MLLTSPPPCGIGGGCAEILKINVFSIRFRIICKSNFLVRLHRECCEASECLFFQYILKDVHRSSLFSKIIVANQARLIKMYCFTILLLSIKPVMLLCFTILLLSIKTLMFQNDWNPLTFAIFSFQMLYFSILFGLQASKCFVFQYFLALMLRNATFYNTFAPASWDHTMGMLMMMVLVIMMIMMMIFSKSVLFCSIPWLNRRPGFSEKSNSTKLFMRSGTGVGWSAEMCGAILEVQTSPSLAETADNCKQAESSVY